MMPQLDFASLNLDESDSKNFDFIGQDGVITETPNRKEVDEQMQQMVQLEGYFPKTEILSSRVDQGLTAQAFYSGKRLSRVVYSKGKNTEGVDQLEIHKGGFNGFELHGKGIIQCPRSICKDSMATQGPVYEGLFQDGVLVEGIMLSYDGSFGRTLSNGRFEDCLIEGMGILYFPNGTAMIGEYNGGFLQKGKIIHSRNDQGVWIKGISSETGFFDINSNLTQGVRRLQDGTIEQVGPPIDDQYLDSLLEFDETRYSRRELFEELLRNME